MTLSKQGDICALMLLCLWRLDSVHEHEHILALQEADAFNVILSELFAVVIYQVNFQ